LRRFHMDIGSPKRLLRFSKRLADWVGRTQRFGARFGTFSISQLASGSEHLYTRGFAPRKMAARAGREE
jgi:hypothetical protein